MKILFALLLTFSLSSCFNSIPNYLPDDSRVQPWDEFKESERYTLSFNNAPKERTSGLLRMYNTFLRELDGDGGDKVQHYVILNKGQSSFYPEADFFVKTDDHIFRLKADQKEVEHFQKTTESTSKIQKADSSTVSVIDSYSTTNYIQQRFAYEMTRELRMAILKSKEVSFRFYGGGLPSTFEVKSNDLKDLKVLLDIL